MIRIQSTHEPDAEHLAALVRGMRDFERSTIPDLPDDSHDIPYHAFARNDDGDVIGGIKAAVYWNGLEVEILWVAPEHRHQGIATRLLLGAERAAIEHGAVVAHLKTVMASGFYESLGYAVFGVLEDRPIGTSLYFMKKRLAT